jgi:hypothetical protein
MLQRHNIFAVIIIFFLFADFTFGQERLEGGVFIGTSYYNGDLNPERLFYKPKPAFGVLTRVVINPRLAFTGSLTAIEIEGEYPNNMVLFPSSTIQSRAAYQFKRSLADLSTQFEINLFPYAHPFRKEETRFTPYISGGLAYTIYKRYQDDETGGSENPQFILSLPFGIGVKYKPSDRIHVGLKWSFRKTFVDDLDKMRSGSIDPSDPYGYNESSNWHNNDWYSFAGVFVTIDLFHRSVSCYA